MNVVVAAVYRTLPVAVSDENLARKTYPSPPLSLDETQLFNDISPELGQELKRAYHLSILG